MKVERKCKIGRCYFLWYPGRLGSPLKHHSGFDSPVEVRIEERGNFCGKSNSVQDNENEWLCLPRSRAALRYKPVDENAKEAFSI